MKRNRLCGAILGGAAGLLLALPTAAEAAEPVRSVTPVTLDAVITSCGFPVQVHIDAEEHALDFGDRLGFTYSDAKATFDNAATGETVRVAVPGPEFLEFNGDGTVTVRAAGPWLWLVEHPITGEPGIWLTYGLVVRLAQNHVTMSAEQHGTSRDLCAELS